MVGHKVAGKWEKCSWVLSRLGSEGQTPDFQLVA